MKRCSYCGKEYGDEAEFCSTDGRSLGIEPPRRGNPFRGSPRLWFGIGIGVCTIIGSFTHASEKTLIFFGLWVTQAIVGSLLSAPILFLGRKRIGWSLWQLLILVIPFCVWAALMLSPLSIGRKSLANLEEPFYISFAMPVLALVRVVDGKKNSERVYAISFIAVLSVIAAAVFFLVPILPE